MEELSYEWRFQNTRMSFLAGMAAASDAARASKASGQGGGTPLFSDKLWKLVDAQGDGKAPGDPRLRRDYRQREFWIAADGVVSFSGDSPGEIVRLFGGKRAQEMELRVLAVGETCFDYAYTLGPLDHPDPVLIASEVAGISGALGRFRKTVEALQSGPGAVEALRRSSAGQGVGLQSTSMGAGTGAHVPQSGTLAGALRGSLGPPGAAAAPKKLSGGFGMAMATKLLGKKKAAYSKTRQEADRRLEKAKAFLATIPDPPEVAEWKPPPVDLRSIVMEPLPVPPRHRERLASPGDPRADDEALAIPGALALVAPPPNTYFMSVWGGRTDSAGAPVRTRGASSDHYSSAAVWGGRRTGSAGAPLRLGAAVFGPPTDIKAQTFSGDFGGVPRWTPSGSRPQRQWAEELLVQPGSAAGPRYPPSTSLGPPRPELSSAGRAAAPRPLDPLASGFSLWGGSSVFSDGNDAALPGSTWGGCGEVETTAWGKSSKSGVFGGGFDSDGGFFPSGSFGDGSFPNLPRQSANSGEAEATAGNLVETRTRNSAVHRRANLVDRAVRLGVLDGKRIPSARPDRLERTPREEVAPLETTTTSGVTQQEQDQRWRSWAAWCRRHNVDPYQPKLRELADAGVAGRKHAAMRKPWQAA